MNKLLVVCITVIGLFTEYLVNDYWKQEMVIKAEFLKEVWKHPIPKDLDPPNDIHPYHKLYPKTDENKSF